MFYSQITSSTAASRFPIRVASRSPKNCDASHARTRRMSGLLTEALPRLRRKHVISVLAADHSIMVIASEASSWSVHGERHPSAERHPTLGLASDDSR
jgi:hypothetical protein